MKFREMQYLRPDAAGIKEKLAAFTEKLRGAASYDEAREVFLEEDSMARIFQSRITLAEIRHSIDTRDEFYDGEVRYWNNMIPEITEYMQNWQTALLESPFRPSFEKEFGEVVFLNAELARKSFDPAIIPLLQQENDLTTDYEKLLASARIPFRGETYTIPQIGIYKNDQDDEVRLAAWKAEGGWYREHQKELDGLYDELVEKRTAMGRALGLKDFVDLGYYRMGRNCYGKEDVTKFREAVRDHLVPLADRIYREQAKRIGAAYPISFSDAALMFRSGNAVPRGGEKEILEAAKKFYEGLSEETAEFFHTMLDGELMDLLSKEGKEGGGYCTSLYEYEVPFIFANFNGTRDDVETVTHEAGHAFADWYNRKRVPMDTIWPGMEGCEVHSMSMEFFAWKSAEDFFGEDARKFRYSHLAGALTFIPYGTMVDHFQHIVYENPELTPAERHAKWKELLGIYMPWLLLDGDIPFYSEGMGWQRQHHIYSSPFYYIDYCLAQTVALELWAMMQDDYEDAWKHYMAYTSQGGSKVFTELLANAGLASPFESGTLKSICEKVGEWLDKYDLTGIR